MRRRAARGDPQAGERQLEHGLRSFHRALARVGAAARRVPRPGDPSPHRYRRVHARFTSDCREAGIRFSVGYELTEAVRAAILKVPESAWIQAINGAGEDRDGAWVTELTDRMDLSEWPEGSRLICRSERPHPGAQFTIFDEHSYRYTCFLTDQEGNDIAVLELRHRGRARVEHSIRAGKDTGMRNLPHYAFEHNQTWLEVSLIAQDLLCCTLLICLTGKLAKAEPKRLRQRLLHVAGKLVSHGRRTQLKLDRDWPCPERSPPRSRACARTPRSAETTAPAGPPTTTTPTDRLACPKTTFSPATATPSTSRAPPTPRARTHQPDPTRHHSAITASRHTPAARELLAVGRCLPRDGGSRTNDVAVVIVTHRSVTPVSPLICREQSIRTTTARAYDRATSYRRRDAARALSLACRRNGDQCTIGPNGRAGACSGCSRWMRRFDHDCHADEVGYDRRRFDEDGDRDGHDRKPAG